MLRARALVLLTVLFSLPGCATVDHDKQRRETFVAANPKLTVSKRAEILHGAWETGMTTEEIEASLGAPDREDETVIAGVRALSWTYYRLDGLNVYTFEITNGALAGWNKNPCAPLSCWDYR